MPTPMTRQKCSEIPKCDPPNPSNQKSNLFLGVVQEHNHQLQQHTGTTWATLHGTEAAIPPFELIEEQENWKGKKKGILAELWNLNHELHPIHKQELTWTTGEIRHQALPASLVRNSEGRRFRRPTASRPRISPHLILDGGVGGGGKRVGEEWRKMGGFWRVQTRWELPFPT
jgi:hypothetical protein